MNAQNAPIGIYAREARAQILMTLRTPQFVVPSTVLPVAFFGLFGVALANGHVQATEHLLATYAVFAALGPAMFGFGAGVAAEREAKLLELKRVSPMPAAAYVTARLAAAVTTTSIALAGIFSVALLAGVTLPFWRWAALFAVGAGSAVPFGLIGVNLGLRLGAQGAVAGANLLFVSFAMLGGLWIPLSVMPAWMTSLAWTLPSYHLGALSLDVAGLTPPRDLLAHLAAVGLTAAVAGGGAFAAWRREDA